MTVTNIVILNYTKCGDKKKTLKSIMLFEVKIPKLPFNLLNKNMSNWLQYPFNFHCFDTLVLQLIKWLVNLSNLLFICNPYKLSNRTHFPFN